MRTILLVLLTALGFTASAQEYYNRQPSPAESRRGAAGLKDYAQDQFKRIQTPVFVLNSLLYLATNKSDGIILVRTNATVLVHIGLPNPTNNVGRRFEVTTMGASTAVLTNWYVTGSFTDMFKMTNSATSYFIESNKTAVAYSTGTNYVVRLH